MSFVERFNIFCPHSGESTIRGFTVSMCISTYLQFVLEQTLLISVVNCSSLLVVFLLQCSSQGEREEAALQQLQSSEEEGRGRAGTGEVEEEQGGSYNLPRGT